MTSGTTQHSDIRGRPDSEACLARVTLLVWACCLAVGVAGFVWSYPRATESRRPEIPVVAQRIEVELDAKPVPIPPAPLSASALPLPPSPPELTLVSPRVERLNIAEPAAATPPLRAAALPPPSRAMEKPLVTLPAVIPSPSAAAVKTTGNLTAIVAAPGQPQQAVTEGGGIARSAMEAVSPLVQPLEIGVGEGKQPLPEYPALARRHGQSGTVLVQIGVSVDGSILSAEAVRPCPWPLLNEAALRAVRQRWKFSPGARRRYEVAIRFELVK